MLYLVFKSIYVFLVDWFKNKVFLMIIMTDNNDFKMVAKTFFGLEDVLSDELLTLGAKKIEKGVRNLHF